ncbi:uncharacterized protein JCM6883_004855 [Sporobolomyces salmoneus]|uniref:uncharacterized protein n=1 Tax=Sporobolomyces salmoneus TaxID=183962 RepID=UPI003178DAE8
MSSQHIAKELTRLALPLIPKHGFTTQTLLLASSSSSQPLSARTIDALYPSPPASIPSPNSFSLKGLAIGNGGKRSLSRPELIALARGQGIVAGSQQEGREKTGPARALFEEWLEEGRREMIKTVRESGLRGEEAMKKGMKERLMYNEQVLDRLPQALALLSAPTTTPLSSPTSFLPSPIPHLSHVASIAQDLAKSSGSQAQGTAWYSLRARLSLIYTLSELHLLSPPSSDPSSTITTPAERIQASILFSEKLWRETGKVGDSIQGMEDFGNWVGKSWMGIGRSLGI